MKNILLFIALAMFSFQLCAQQSTTSSERPENVSIGKIGKDTKTQVVISDVPIYLWQRGCGPTALGMVIGYYDTQGYSDLIPGDASTQTSDVDDAIANDEHFDDYSLPLDYWPNLESDNSELGGAHSNNCIADYMKTSWSSLGNYWGWSWSSDISIAFTAYVNQQNSEYFPITEQYYYSLSAWEDYKNEIDNNRPVVFLVDSDGDGSTDHFVTGIGYDDATHEYAIYDTWDTDIHWYTFQGISTSNSWGIYGFSVFQLASQTSISKNIQQISVFPNPTTDFITIEIPNNINQLQLEVFDLTGKLIVSTNETKIDFSNFENGIYIIKINTGLEVYFEKIIKK